jgi:hypothetical protein
MIYKDKNKNLFFWSNLNDHKLLRWWLLGWSVQTVTCSRAKTKPNANSTPSSNTKYNTDCVPRCCPYTSSTCTKKPQNRAPIVTEILWTRIDHLLQCHYQVWSYSTMTMLQKNHIYGIAEKSLQQYHLEGGNMMIISVVAISIITKCQTIITFITNCSDELQWLPTDAIGSQKVGIDK